MELGKYQDQKPSQGLQITDSGVPMPSCALLPQPRSGGTFTLILVSHNISFSSGLKGGVWE